MANCAKNKMCSLLRQTWEQHPWPRKSKSFEVDRMLLSNTHLQPMFWKWEETHFQIVLQWLTVFILQAGRQTDLAVKNRLRIVTQNAPRVHLPLLAQFSRKQGEFYILAVFTELEVNTKEGRQGDTLSNAKCVCAASRYLCVFIYCGS